jgi:hypothetical protein
LKYCLFDYAKNVVFTHDQVVSPFNFNLGAGILPEENAISFFYLQRDSFAVVAEFTVTDSRNFTFRRFFFCRIRDDNPALCLFFLFNTFD